LNRVYCNGQNNENNNKNRQEYTNIEI